MTRQRLIIVTIICILLAVFILKINQCIAVRSPVINRIPSPQEIQQELADRGYYAGIVDGDIGRETKQAWQNALYDQQRGQIKQRMKKSAASGKTIKQIINEK